MHTDEIMIGLDPHKASNTIAVLDRAETVHFRRRFDQSEQGIDAMLAAVAAWPNRVWAVGVGPLNGALILGEVGNIARFDTRDQFASYAGTAPLSVSSGDHNRHRLSRAGNRQLNSAIHIAAITQIRNDTPGRAYYRRKLDEGKSAREALRCLKRRITDAVWRQLRADLKPRPDNPDTSPPAETQPTPRPIVGTGSRRGHSKASAPRRKLITPPATRQQTSSTARLEPAP
jgi:hypothetical protein